MTLLLSGPNNCDTKKSPPNVDRLHFFYPIQEKVRPMLETDRRPWFRWYHCREIKLWVEKIWAVFLYQWVEFSFGWIEEQFIRVHPREKKREKVEKVKKMEFEGVNLNSNLNLKEWKKCTAGCHQHSGGIWLSSWRWQSQEELYVYYLDFNLFLYW